MDRHLERLHATAVRLLDDAAEAQDVCQDTFVKAWEIAPRWRPGRARFSSWLYGVALNGCRDRLRRRRPQAPVDTEAIGARSAGPERHAEQANAARAVREAVAALPERQREALVLFHFEGLTQAEAAQLLEISVPALESLLARARRSLRERLGPLRQTMGVSPP